MLLLGPPGHARLVRLLLAALLLGVVSSQGGIGFVSVRLCDVSSGCSSNCGTRVEPEGVCALPVAPSGLGVPVMLKCLGDGHVNATFFDSNRGVCDSHSYQWGGTYKEGSCVDGTYLSYSFACVPPDESLKV